MAGQKLFTAAALATTLVASFVLTREASHSLRSAPAGETRPWHFRPEGRVG